MPFIAGPPVLCDLGEARIGDQKHGGDIMPGIYRAPEVVLEMGWDYKVDIWAVGVMVSATLQREELILLVVHVS
jgi:serine/threonine-protein kinase SRPK3